MAGILGYIGAGAALGAGDALLEQARRDAEQRRIESFAKIKQEYDQSNIKLQGKIYNENMEKRVAAETAADRELNEQNNKFRLDEIREQNRLISGRDTDEIKNMKYIQANYDELKEAGIIPTRYGKSSAQDLVGGDKLAKIEKDAMDAYFEATANMPEDQKPSAESWIRDNMPVTAALLGYSEFRELQETSIKKLAEQYKAAADKEAAKAELIEKYGPDNAKLILIEAEKSQNTSSQSGTAKEETGPPHDPGEGILAPWFSEALGNIMRGEEQPDMIGFGRTGRTANDEKKSFLRTPPRIR